MNSLEATLRERGLEGWAGALFDAIDDAVFVHDARGNILEANQAACRRLGYSRNELLRLNTADIDAPEFAAGFQDRLRAQLATGAHHCEGLHRTKDGRVIPVDINTSAILFRDRPAVLAVMRDITKRKQAQERIEKQERLLQSILDNMGDAVVVADADGKFIVFNPAAQKMFDLAPGARAWPEHDGLFLADQVTPFPEGALPLARAIRGEEVDDLEMFVRHREAPAGIWTSITGRPLRDEGGRVRGGVIVCRDITAHKRAESRREAQYAVARALAGDTLEEAARQVLRVMGQTLACDSAALFVVNSEENHLRCLETWHRPELNTPEFETMTRRIAFPPGVGLPGRVWQSGCPEVCAQTNPGSPFPREAVAAREGLHGGLAFPTKSGGVTTGVVEFLYRRPVKADADLFAMTEALGSQIGQVLERRRIEKALRDTEALYESLVDCLPQNIFRKDLEGRLTFANKRYCETLKRSARELIGKTDFDLFPREMAVKYVGDDHHVLQTGAVLDAVEEHRLPDGAVIHVQVVKTPIHDAHGTIIGTQGIFWDVTEKTRAEAAVKESELRYRKLTEATQDGIVVADQTGTITLFNPAAERLFGYAAAEVLGQPLTELMPEEFQGQHLRAFERYLATRQSRIIGRASVELRARRKDGSEFPIELALSAMSVGPPGPDGKEPLQFLGAIRDLTERNRMRAVVVQNEKLASIGLLSAGVAHEINNPLAFVANNLVVLERDCRGLMELVSHYEACRPRLAQADEAAADRALAIAADIDLDYLGDNLPRLLKRTRDGVDRVTRIVHSLRGLARTDAPKRQEAQIPDLIETSLEILRGRLRQAAIEVVQDHDPLPRIACVSSQISQVLLNLLLNALQAIEAAGKQGGRRPGKIAVKTRRLDAELLIEVSDNGCGIEQAHLPLIFDPFFTTKDVGEGTGLGLSISHNIVTGHGGRFEVESTPGAGSCFRVYLPLHDNVRGKP
jgi:PAS domain S-box-containing protein